MMKNLAKEPMPEPDLKDDDDKEDFGLEDKNLWSITTSNFRNCLAIR